MQSTNLKASVSISEAFAALVDSLRAVTTANVITKTDKYLEFQGNFSKFTFTENPANAYQKRLYFEGKCISNKCTLRAENVVRAPISGLELLTIGDSVTIKEVEPFFLDATVKTLNNFDKIQPSIILPRPLKEKIDYSENSNSFDHFFDLLLVFSDSIDATWNQPMAGTVGTEVQDKYLTYIYNPLMVYVRQILDKIDNFKYNNGTRQVFFQVDEGAASVARVGYVRRFGAERGLVELGFDENLGGFVVELPIWLRSADCLIN